MEDKSNCFMLVSCCKLMDESTGKAVNVIDYISRCHSLGEAYKFAEEYEKEYSCKPDVRLYTLPITSEILKDMFYWLDGYDGAESVRRFEICVTK